VGQVIADLMRSGVQVCLPISEHLPFDLVAVSPSLNVLSRIQVRYSAVKRGTLRLDLRMSHADRHGVHTRWLRLEEIDAFAIFCPQTNEVYYVKRGEIPVGMRSVVSLRVMQSRNGQKKRTRPANAFVGADRLFGPVA
jgi:hypothetical protein